MYFALATLCAAAGIVSLIAASDAARRDAIVCAVALLFLFVAWGAGALALLTVGVLS